MYEKTLNIFLYAYIILLPYVVYVLYDVRYFIPVLILLVVLTVFALVIINISAVHSGNNKFFSVMNLILKICCSCTHGFIFYVMYVVREFSVFIFAISHIMFIVISLCILAVSGFSNIGNCISLCRNKKCGSVKAVVLGITGFVYVLDIIGAVIQLICSFRKKGD